VGSKLDKLAQSEGWRERFPMWDWIGGRTSETAAVGLLPAALQGFNIDEMLRGAKACDEITRVNNAKVNPAAQLALMWFYIGNDKGAKDMVILPYKDRLELFSRYIQQLAMESLGKEFDLDGKMEGIAMYGNKGSTDQHAYIQQLRDGETTSSLRSVL
jgi:glucose-6-phosphate isomerase